MAAPVRIERIAAGGDGVGRLADGRVVFVPRTAPGDLVTLAGLREHGRFARASVGALLEPGPARVVPACPHYAADACGGCQLQHLAPEAQRAARAGIVGDALRRLARRDVADPPIEAAPADWGYRTRLTLHPSRDGRRLGMHRVGRPGDIFEVTACLLAEPGLRTLWDGVRRHRGLLPRPLEEVTLRRERNGRLHLLVAGADARAWGGGRDLAAALAADGTPATVWWRPPQGVARAVAGAETAFPATVFEQVHPVMGDRVRAAALAALGAGPGDHAWDLYAGIGEATRALAAAGARVESVEADRRAVELAAREGDAEGRIIRHAGTAEQLIGALGVPDLVYTNPPRAGMDAAVVDAVAAARPRCVAYVSCDPATLARDIARLGDGWRLASVTAYDLFPQTAHVETLAVLEPA